MWTPTVACVPEAETEQEDRSFDSQHQDPVSQRREWLAPSSVNSAMAPSASDGASEQCCIGDAHLAVQASRLQEIPRLPLLHMQAGQNQGEERTDRSPQESPEILLTVSQLQKQVCELQDVVRSLSTSHSLPRHEEASSQAKDVPQLVARTASEERLLQMYREHRAQTQVQENVARDGAGSRSQSPMVPQTVRNNSCIGQRASHTPRRVVRNAREEQSPRRQQVPPQLPCPEGMAVSRSSSSSHRIRPQRPAPCAETAPNTQATPWKALCQRFLPCRPGKWPSAPFTERPGMLQREIAEHVREVLTNMFGALEVAAVRAALDLRLCCEEQVDEFIVDTLKELAGPDESMPRRLLSDAPLSDLQACLPPVKLALPQFEETMLEVFPVLLSRRTARRLFQFLDVEHSGLVELTHLTELDRICSYHGCAMSSRRSPSPPTSGRLHWSHRSPNQVIRSSSSGDVEDKQGRTRRSSRAPSERASPKIKNKSISPEWPPGEKLGGLSSKASSTNPTVDIIAHSGVQLEVEMNQVFCSMLRPTPGGKLDCSPNQALPSSTRRSSDDRSETATTRTYRAPLSERTSRRPYSPNAPSRSGTTDAPRSVSPQPPATVSREVSRSTSHPKAGHGGASKVRWSPPSATQKDVSRGHEEERMVLDVERLPPPKGGVVATSTFSQNLPAHRDPQSEEAKKRASSLQSLLAFAAEVQARQHTEPPSTGASSCHEDEPQREPPVTPPAPVKVPPLAMSLQHQQQLMSLKADGLEESVETTNKNPVAPSPVAEPSPPLPSPKSFVFVSAPPPLVDEQLQNSRGCISGNPHQAGNHLEEASLKETACAPTPPVVELLAEPLGPTRTNSDSSLGNLTPSCVIATTSVNAPRQVYSSPQAGPFRASSATSPRIRVRPPETETPKASQSVVFPSAALHGNAVHGDPPAPTRSKTSPLWPQPALVNDPLQRTARFGQAIATAYGQQRFTQANIAAVASSNATVAPTTSMSRVHSPTTNFVGSLRCGNSFSPMIGRKDRTASPRSPTSINP